MFECLDLRGVRCPLNWAKARVRLEQLPAGAILELLLDDPKAVRDIPQAAESAGFVVVGVEANAEISRIVLQK